MSTVPPGPKRANLRGGTKRGHNPLKTLGRAGKNAVRPSAGARTGPRLKRRRGPAHRTNSMAQLTRSLGSALWPTWISNRPGSRTRSRPWPMNDRSSTGSRHVASLRSPARERLLHALQLQQRPSDARDQIAHEQEQRRFAVHLAVVADRRATTSIASPAFTERRLAAKIAERKAAVGEAVSERKLRRRRLVEIGARVVHAGRVGAAGRALVVEDRNLPDMARPAHRQSSRRIELPGQNVGDGVSGLAARETRSQAPRRPARTATAA